MAQLGVVIGVHTPEFSFEHDIELVRRAVAVRGIDHPVAADNDDAIWDAFANRYWPALYFADTDGVIRGQHFGEGRYAESERMIQRLLGVERAFASVTAEGVEAEADRESLRTAETYLGSVRGERFGERLRLNHWTLDGADVDEAGGGVLDDGRLYQLVRARGTVRERTVEIEFLEPGAEAYAFTFG